MARRSQCSSAGDNPLDPNYLAPHYREEYRLAIDALVEADVEGYYGFLQEAKVVDFLSRPEIEYIKCMVQGPRQIAQLDSRCLSGDGDGSSDTYWPIQSDLDAPGLELGWPQIHRFVGPTEITTLVNPSAPEMPSIKEHVRRMIKNAQQVVAVAMDMFTDVDIFADILNAAMRNVAVYVLLDELNAHHFVAMANNCSVNLDEIKFLRVRTVSGSTYFCHTGMSFKGQMTNRFVLVDCRIVLSGNYSFTWSFEKIHRYIAHVFLGELVATFDEEFRILYAHSEPLVTESPVTYVEDYGNLTGRHNMRNTQIFHNASMEDIHAEWPGQSVEDQMNVRPMMIAFRKGESVHSSTDEHLPPPAHPPQQFRGEYSYIDQRRLLKDPKMRELGGFKRQGYTGVPNYLQMSAVNRGQQYIEGSQIQSAHFPKEQFFNQRTGPDTGYDVYGKSRDRKYNQLDQFPEPDFPHEMDNAELRRDYDHVQRYLHSCPALEAAPAGNLLQPVQSTPRRHSRGQSYTCQTSPTQPNAPDQKYFLNVHHKRQDQKEGLRDWRISSYLTALQLPGKEDMTDLHSTDYFDSGNYVMQGGPCEPEISETRQDNSEFSKGPTSKVNPIPPLLSTLTLPEKSLDLPVERTTPRPTPPTASESSCNTEGDKLELQNRELKETNLIRDEFVRRRPNLALQRSSRLRHSLIFNSNLEQHTSEDLRNPSNQNDGDNPSKHSLVVSNILEKKTPATKEPIQWSSLVKSCKTSSDSAVKADSEDLLNKEEGSEGNKCETTDTLLKESEQPQDVFAKIPQTAQCPPAALQRSVSFVDMNDPECRLRYFKELAAKRKAELALANLSTKDTPSKVPDKPKKSLLSDTVGNKPAVESPKNPQAETVTLPTAPKKMPDGSSQDRNKEHDSQNLHDKHLKHKVYPEFKKTQELSCTAIHTSATDAEKIKLKQQLTDSSKMAEDKSACAASLGIHLSTNTEFTCQLGPVPSISSPGFTSPQTTLPKDTDSGAYSSPTVQTLKNSTLCPADSISSEVITDANMSFQARNGQSSSADFSPENVIANTGTCQHPTGTERDLSKNLVPALDGSSQHSNSADNAQKWPAKDTCPSHHPPVADQAKEMYLIQHPSEKETGPSQHPTPKNSVSSQPPNAYPSKHSTEIWPSQPPAPLATSPSESVSFLHPDPSESCFHHSPDIVGTSPPAPSTQVHCVPNVPNVLDFTGELTPSTLPISDSHASSTSSATDITYSDNTTTKTNTIPPTGLLLESTLPSNSTEVELGLSQHATATETGFIPESSMTKNCNNVSANTSLSATPNDVTQKDMDSILPPISQNFLNTCSDTISPSEPTSDLSLTLTETSPTRGTLQTDKSGHTVPGFSLLPLTTSETNSPNSKILSENDCANATVEIICVASPSTESSPLEPEMTSPVDSSPTETEFPETSLTDTPKKDKNKSMTNTSSLIKHSPSDLLPNCSPLEPSSVPHPVQKDSTSGSGEIQVVTPTQSLVDTVQQSDSYSSSLAALASETDILEHNPSEVCQPVNQVVTETFLDTPQSSSCLPHDPESEERTDEDQNKDPGSEERTDEDQNKDPGSEERTDEDQNKDPGSEERTDKDQDKDPGSEERTDEDQDKDPGSEERTDEDQDKDPGSEERTDEDQDKDPGSEERTDEDRDKDPIREQTQQQKESCDSERYAAVEVSTDLGNDRTDDIKEAALGEDAGSSNAEKPQEPQPCIDVLNHQPLTAKNPAHQSSTVNVLSCSNLRDDTKVLLEQISAKNQGRASKMSGTHHAKQDEADGSTGLNKQISGHTSRSQSWSSKASPEEREKLLKKMESMRKEKKVYSRFEAS